ncbi:MAG: hypothetical protein PHY45_09075 [Rhodocyclaceae bacterium]|nr:hypothetical protein [Rhodocyclaceae bacterium]
MRIAKVTPKSNQSYGVTLAILYRSQNCRRNSQQLKTGVGSHRLDGRFTAGNLLRIAKVTQNRHHTYGVCVVTGLSA